MECKKDFFINEEDKNSMMITNDDGFYLYVICPFGCDKDVGGGGRRGTYVLELGEKEFDDQSSLEKKKIDSLTEKLEEILHELENIGVKQDDKS